MNRRLFISVLAVQAVLLLLEFALPYDVWVRKFALMATNVIGTAILVAVARRLQALGRPFPASAAWLVVAGIWFDALGNFLFLYGRWTWWDKLAHAAGTAGATGALWLTIREFVARKSIRLSGTQFSLTVLGLTSLLYVLYEVTEYLGDLLFNTRRVIDAFDTPDDLMWNLVASVLVCVLFPVLYRSAAIDRRGQSQ